MFESAMAIAYALGSMIAVLAEYLIRVRVRVRVRERVRVRFRVGVWCLGFGVRHMLGLHNQSKDSVPNSHTIETP